MPPSKLYFRKKHFNNWLRLAILSYKGSIKYICLSLIQMGLKSKNSNHGITIIHTIFEYIHRKEWHVNKYWYFSCMFESFWVPFLNKFCIL